MVLWELHDEPLMLLARSIWQDKGNNEAREVQALQAYCYPEPDIVDKRNETIRNPNIGR